AELNHRVKNTLAIVQSIASHSRQAALSPDEFHKAFTSRLHALAEAHDLLTQTHWKGALLQQVIDAALKPFAGNERALDRISANGPVVWIAANTAVTLTLAFHELATNATKYGALSNDNGRIDVVWTPDPGQAAKELHLHWREKGGPPVTPPIRKGFGTMLMEKVLAYEADCQAQLAFAPTGLEFHFRLPLSDNVSLV